MPIYAGPPTAGLPLLQHVAAASVSENVVTAEGGLRALLRYQSYCDFKTLEPDAFDGLMANYQRDVAPALVSHENLGELKIMMRRRKVLAAGDMHREIAKALSDEDIDIQTAGIEHLREKYVRADLPAFLHEADSQHLDVILMFMTVENAENMNTILEYTQPGQMLICHGAPEYLPISHHDTFPHPDWTENDFLSDRLNDKHVNRDRERWGVFEKIRSISCTSFKNLPATASGLQPFRPHQSYSDLMDPFWRLAKFESNYHRNFGYALVSLETLIELKAIMIGKKVLEASAGSGYISKALSCNGIDIKAADSGSDESWKEEGLWQRDLIASMNNIDIKGYDIIFASWPNDGAEWMHKLADNMQPGKMFIYRGYAASNRTGPGNIFSNPDFRERTELSKKLNEKNISFNTDKWWVFEKIFSSELPS